jgi:hypothetical protein
VSAFIMSESRISFHLIIALPLRGATASITSSTEPSIASAVPARVPPNDCVVGSRISGHLGPAQNTASLPCLVISFSSGLLRLDDARH